MPFVYNLHRQKNIRRHLRNNATRTERWLWFYLRNRQVDNLKFRRQYGIRQYIVDFYCPEVGLAIEIDGEPHERFANQQRHDQERQRRLEALGVRLLRFSPGDVLENIEGILGKITRVARDIRQGLSAEPASTTHETSPHPS